MTQFCVAQELYQPLDVHGMDDLLSEGGYECQDGEGAILLVLLEPAS